MSAEGSNTVGSKRGAEGTAAGAGGCWPPADSTVMRSVSPKAKASFMASDSSVALDMSTLSPSESLYMMRMGPGMLKRERTCASKAGQSPAAAWGTRNRRISSPRLALMRTSMMATRSCELMMFNVDYAKLLS